MGTRLFQTRAVLVPMAVKASVRRSSSMGTENTLMAKEKAANSPPTALPTSSIAHPTGFYTIDAIIAGNLNALWDAVWHLVLPALTLGYAAVGIVTRMMRSSLLEEMGKDYVDAARARGLPERLVVRRHARRNAFIPTITVIGLAIGIMFEGTVVVETIFGWPGLGNWMADSVLSGDQATTLAFVIFTSILFLTVNLIVDVSYAWFDPRIRLGDRAGG